MHAKHTTKHNDDRGEQEEDGGERLKGDAQERAREKRRYTEIIIKQSTKHHTDRRW
jgi:hypothetical protein